MISRVSSSLFFMSPSFASDFWLCKMQCSFWVSYNAPSKL
jgi:hypothetical protein